MKNLIKTLLVISLITPSALAQSNKIVFGPLEGDDAGVLTVHNGEAIEIELWVRTDPGNPTPVIGVSHGLLSEDIIIAERNGMDPEPEYDVPNWESFFIDGPFVHDPNDAYPLPPGWTCEMQVALCYIDFPIGDCLNTQGEWDLYGTWLMVTNTEIPVEQTYYPFAMGWYPHSGQGTSWAFEVPPGGIIEPEQSYCGLNFVPECDYIPGDCNSNGIAWELSDVITMIVYYRGSVEPSYTCYCPPHGDNYPPGADPNGNCVPFELTDVVYMMRVPPWPSLGCPDCPGSERLLIEQDKD